MFFHTLLMANPEQQGLKLHDVGHLEHPYRAEPPYPPHPPLHLAYPLRPALSRFTYQCRINRVQNVGWNPQRQSHLIAFLLMFLSQGVNDVVFKAACS